MGKKIAIIGGMGALASARIHSEILTSIVKQGVNSDADFPFLTHFSLSVENEGFTGDFSTSENWANQARAVKHALDGLRPEIIFVACMSAAPYIYNAVPYAQHTRVITPAKMLKNSSEKWDIIAARSTCDNKLVGEQHSYHVGSGIEELALTGVLHQDSRYELLEQVASVENPILACTEYALLMDDPGFKKIPNISTMLVKEVLAKLEKNHSKN